MNGTARIAGLTGACFIFLSATLAAAQPPPEPPDLAATDPAPSPASMTRDERIARARHHFEAGRQYYGEGRFEDAAREFQEAYRLTEHPDVLYNLASCYDRLERREQAIREYERYLEEKPDTPDRQRIEIRIRELHIVMDAIARAEQPPAVSEPPQPPAEVDVGQRDEPPLLPVGSWVAFGIGGASLIGAILTGVIAASLHSNVEDSCSADGCDPALRDDASTGETLSVVSTVLTGVAIAGAATGVALMLFRDDDDDATVRTVEVAPGPAALGATARVRF